MATLKELMGDKTRGNGRKFTRKINWFSDAYFEPIFKSDANGQWFGVNNNGYGSDFCEDSFTDWEEWTPPKQKKKVKLYRPIRKLDDEEYALSDWWCDDKESFIQNEKRKVFFIHKKGVSRQAYSHVIVGWQEIEVEVDK